MSLHPEVEQRLARLTPDQRAAATAPPGPVLCIAPAGSGKTTTLVARIAWLVDQGEPPDTITAVTFNKRAAVELAERLDVALAPLGCEPGSARVRTFHALGREILREAGVGVERLVDRAALLRELDGARMTTARLRQLDDAFSRLKLDAALDPDAVRPPPAILDAYRRYSRALAERGALDFDDLACRSLAVLRDEPQVLAAWRERCAHLLVDEVQDTDRTQLTLAHLLGAPANRLFLVGDDDQTIYAWRLADVRRLLELAGSLPGLRRVDLITNHRCPGPVVRRAVRLVEHNRERFAKAIVPRRPAPGDLVLAPDAGDEVARARRVLPAHGRDEPPVAILARTNAELVPYAAVALERDLPYAVDDDGLLLDDPWVDRLLDAAEELTSHARGLPLLVALGRARASAPRAARLVAAAILAWAPRYADLATFRAGIADARVRRATLRETTPLVTLATAHGTKGLEFDRVVCVGLDEGRFPSARTLAEADAPARVMEEERRLAYVAWTRARSRLVLVYDPEAPSPFMTEAFDADELRPPRRGDARQRQSGMRRSTA